MAEYFLHYTSRQAAQEIVISGKLQSSHAGARIYLTKEIFPYGAEAAKRLAIVGKPVEAVFFVPEDRIVKLLEVTEPRHVEPIIGPDGDDIRPGCGEEFFTKPDVEIDMTDLFPYEVPFV